MTAVRQYLLTVICASFICAVIPGIAGKENKQVLRLICNIFLTVIVVTPIVKIEPMSLLDSTLSGDDAEEVAAYGKNMASDAMTTIINNEMEAYILDKAQRLDMELKVELILDAGEVPVPVGVFLYGSASEEQKIQLEEMLSRDLGIPKEAQKWISD